MESNQDFLLTTRLSIPPVRPVLVPRPRLLEQLDKNVHERLTLVSASAGFGKTTLLSALPSDREPINA
jgi:LuxR family maltose regulon positive regulatory protein